MYPRVGANCHPPFNRIQWISHLINNAQDPQIFCWENKRGSNDNTVLWLRSEMYRVILSKRSNYYLLTTAYVHDDRKGRTNLKETEIYADPRKG